MKYDNFGNLPFASTQHFNINLTKFCQSDVKGGMCFFFSSLGWSVISSNLKERECNYP